MPGSKAPVSFLVFFLLWARVQRWQVPELHVRIANWLEECRDPTRVLLVFRGAAKSTIYAVYKAWQLYCDRSARSLIWAADDKLATKLTRDTLNVLRRHPLCKGMLPPKPGAQSFWINGATDARNPSLDAVGVNSNATGSRADAIDFDDVEVPKNIKTPEARANLRAKIEESTHIAVPGGQKTYIGTPHTHDSIYTEQIEGGAAVLKIPLFEHVRRHEKTDQATRYRFDFEPGTDGLYVILGIGGGARILAVGADYQVERGEVVFAAPPRAVLDICAGCAWPERFTRADIEQRRRATRTLNAWDSQYQLEAKPAQDIRLDPEKIIAYDLEPRIREANNAAELLLGSVRIVGAAAYWDCSLGKLKSDASVFSIVFTDARGQLYWHVAEGLLGELADFNERGQLVGGQCAAIRGLVVRYRIGRVEVETNGPGGFVPPILRRALAGTGCGVAEVFNKADKRARILDAFEPVLSVRALWAHRRVLEGPLWDQMKDFSPGVRDQPDDYLDSGAGAISATPVRLGHVVGTSTGGPRKDWRPASGVHEVRLELE